MNKVVKFKSKQDKEFEKLLKQAFNRPEHQYAKKLIDSGEFFHTDAFVSELRQKIFNLTSMKPTDYNRETGVFETTTTSEEKQKRRYVRIGLEMALEMIEKQTGRNFTEL